MKEDPKEYGIFYGLLYIPKMQEYVFRIFDVFARMGYPFRKFSAAANRRSCNPPHLNG